MKVTEVKNEDGRACAILIKALTNGRWDMSGADAEALMSAKRWLQGVATQMADQLRSPQDQQSTGMKIKAVGSLPVAKGKKRK